MNSASASTIVVLTALSAGISQSAGAQSTVLEEIIVTAQKREESLQSTPFAISALGASQLEDMGVFSIDDFKRGTVPQLQVQTLPINPWTLHLTIRGIGNLDVSQLTRESPVAIYVDDVYLGRAQGLAMQVADLERVEILRGPQGTLFGRNAVGGALYMVTSKPSGEFSFSQALSAGNYDFFRSITRVDLPSVAGFSAKIDYFTSQRDGWVENTARNENDFSELEKDGGRLSIRWEPAEDWLVDYAYEESNIEGTVNYFRYERDPGNVVGGAEPDRVTRSRISYPFMDPSKNEHTGHSLVASWAANDFLGIKSITAYRDMEQRDRTNFAGSFGVGWYSPKSNLLEQDQFSQEFQFVGSSASAELDYVVGLYYFEEETEEFYEGRGYLIPDFTGSFQDLHLGDTIFVSSQDLFGMPSYPSQFVNGFTVGLTGDPSLLNLDLLDVRNIISDAENYAAYAQSTWAPDAFSKRLRITAGLRYSRDEKSGRRPIFLGASSNDTFAFDEDFLDYTFALAWDWTDSINSYFRIATAYQGGGVNIRSASFDPFGAEEATSVEVGIKSELFNNRVRFNAAIFSVEYDDLQLDFLTPAVQTETINASNGSEIEGLELELSARLTPNLLFNLNYNYLDWELPLQPNTTKPGAPLERFDVPQAPEHASAVSLKYESDILSFANLQLYVDVTSRSKLFSSSQSYVEQGDYTLFNARATLAQIALGENYGDLSISLWGYNLTDEKYEANVVSNPPQLVVGQNEPRMYGIDIRYEFQSK